MVRDRLLTVVILLSVILAPIPQAAEELKVSQVGKDKSELLKAFEQVQKMELNKDSSKSTFVVVDRVSETEFEVRHKGGGMDAYFLKTLKARDAKRGESLDDIRYTWPTNMKKSYTTGYGVKKTLPVLNEIEVELMTQEDFVARLKDGETWKLGDLRRKECPECMGKGKKPEKDGGGFCVNCRQSGTLHEIVVVKW